MEILKNGSSLREDILVAICCCTGDLLQPTKDRIMSYVASAGTETAVEKELEAMEKEGVIRCDADGYFIRRTRALEEASPKQEPRRHRGYPMQPSRKLKNYKKYPIAERQALKRLRQAFKEKAVPQSFVALALDVSENTLRNWTTGRNFMSDEHGEKLEKFFGMEKGALRPLYRNFRNKVFQALCGQKEKAVEPSPEQYAESLESPLRREEGKGKSCSGNCACSCAKEGLSVEEAITLLYEAVKRESPDDAVSFSLNFNVFRSDFGYRRLSEALRKEGIPIANLRGEEIR